MALCQSQVSKFILKFDHQLEILRDLRRRELDFFPVFYYAGGGGSYFDTETNGNGWAPVGIVSSTEKKHNIFCSFGGKSKPGQLSIVM